MNNINEENDKIEETKSDGGNDVQQTTIESDEKYNDITTTPNMRGTAPCPVGQARNPVTGKCEDV